MREGSEFLVVSRSGAPPCNQTFRIEQQQVNVTRIRNRERGVELFKTVQVCGGEGRMYDNGEGVPQDDVEATRWYRLAEDQGHAEARQGVTNSNRPTAITVEITHPTRQTPTARKVL